MAGGRGRVCLGAEACATGEETRGDDSAVVEDEEVAWVEEAGEVAEVPVLVGACGAVEREHAAVAALGGRVLRDEVGGKMEVEVGYAHRFYESSESASQQVSAVFALLWREQFGEQLFLRSEDGCCA